MLFNSFQFLCVFLPIVVGGYWLLARTLPVSLSIAWLAVASYVFYVSGEHTYPWLLAVSVVANFLLGQAISAAPPDRSGVWLAAGVIGNLGLLGYYKYAVFVTDQLRWAGAEVPALHVVLPIGISFYTFTQIAYLVDVRRGATRERSFVSYLLFVSYFPHLIAGPILHHGEMLPQFRAPARDTLRRICSGLIIFAIGLVKKTVLADPCGAVATDVFSRAAVSPPGLVTAWVGAFAYAMQIYFDFSGYCDMAIGASQMLGIKLPINFNSPYKALSIIDFWRRWHITLSRFLRDYVYIPLGGNRKGPSRRYVNLLATMVLGGIWHGAGWTFVIWGSLHAAAQGIAHGWNDLGRRVHLVAIPKLVGWALTFVFVVLAWVPFRADSLASTLAMWRGMFGGNGFGMPAVGPLAGIAERLGLGAENLDALTPSALLTLAVAFGIALAAPNSQEILHRFDIALDTPGYRALGNPSRLTLVHLDWRVAVGAGVLLGVGARMIGGPSEFLYFQF